jgi:hypothetical protein
VAFSAMVRRLMVSAPGDVLDEDWDVVVNTVLRWNRMYGEGFGACVTPLRWKDHTGPSYGTHPQTSINDQLVEQADGLLALFWNRIGTPTETSESGTVEEIELAWNKGKTVGILRCTRQADPRDLEPDQMASLRTFFEGNRTRALILDYPDNHALAKHVDTFLTQMVTKDQVSAQMAATSQVRAQADVWARIDTSDQVKTDSKGRLKTSKSWHLVLFNSGDVAAHNVRFRLENEQPGGNDGLPAIFDEDPHIEVLAPKGEARWLLGLHMGSTDQARCLITWVEGGEDRQNIVTLRFY